MIPLIGKSGIVLIRSFIDAIFKAFYYPREINATFAGALSFIRNMNLGKLVSDNKLRKNSLTSTYTFLIFMKHMAFKFV